MSAPPILLNPGDPLAAPSVLNLRRSLAGGSQTFDLVNDDFSLTLIARKFRKKSWSLKFVNNSC